MTGRKIYILSLFILFFNILREMKPLFFFAPIYEIFWTKFGVMIFLIILAEQFGLLFHAVENKKKYINISLKNWRLEKINWWFDVTNKIFGAKKLPLVIIHKKCYFYVLPKGQTISGWIYELIVSPKTRNCQDSCPV